jgi:hypothetical protein
MRSIADGRGEGSFRIGCVASREPGGDGRGVRVGEASRDPAYAVRSDGMAFANPPAHELCDHVVGTQPCQARDPRFHAVVDDNYPVRSTTTILAG